MKFTLPIRFTAALLVSAFSLSAAAQSEKLFKNWDKNADGFLQKSEVPEGPRKIFDQKDINGDGKVSMEEHLGKAKKKAAAVAIPKPSKRVPVSNEGAAFTIIQKWSQHPDGFERPVWAVEPKERSDKVPVVIFFHGNGGKAASSAKGWARSFPEHLVVAPQGYLQSWNIQAEDSKAPDVKFFRLLLSAIEEKYPYADMENVSLIGSSNGGGYIHRLMIEVDEPLFTNAVPMVASLLEDEFHEGSFWYPSTVDTGNYDTKRKPVVAGRRVLYIHGTKDSTVPFYGGLRWKTFMHLSAYETAFRWAQVHGYEGEMLEEKHGKEVVPGLVKIHYPETNVTLIQVQEGDHGLAPHRQAAVRLVKAFINAEE